MLNKCTIVDWKRNKHILLGVKTMLDKLSKTENLVYQIMLEKLETRSDDFKLIYEVYTTLNNKVKYLKFDIVMNDHKRFNLPSFHTISRARRKVFEKYPHLKPSGITEQRMDAEESYREYART